MKPWLLLWLLCACAPGALAQPETPLRRAVEAAWARSLERPATAGLGEVARAREIAADSPWAAPPVVELGYRGDPLSSVAGQREAEVGLAWPLLLPGQRAARAAEARGALDSAEAGGRAAKLRVAGAVRDALWQVQAGAAELSLAEARAAGMRSLAEDVERRVAAGDLARSDSLAIRAERLAAEAEVAGARQQLDSARAAWQLLTGMDVVPEVAESEARAMADDHPEIALAVRNVQAAQDRLDLTRAERSDPPELLLRYRQEVAASGAASQNSIGLAMRLPLGTRDRNLPREALAQSELDVARAEEQRVRARVHSAFTVARAAAQSAASRLEAEESRAALLRERARLIELSFRAGETALPELLRTLAAAAQAEAAVVRQRAGLGLARARTQQSAGVLP